MNAPNPKKAYGDKKPALHLLPLAGMIHQSLAHMDGDYKYGFENWNDMPVEKLTYIGAALRHLELYKYGETHARDTGVHNLGGVMACCAILLDAELNGNLIDNSKHSQATCDLLHNAEAIVERLKQMQRDRDAAKEQARKDQSWADAANADEQARKAATFDKLKTEALDRCTVCGSVGMEDYCGNRLCPAQQTTVLPAAQIITELTDLEKKLYSVTPVETCHDCKTKYGCQRVGVCFKDKPSGFCEGQ